MVDTFVFRVNNLAVNYPMLKEMARTLQGSEIVRTQAKKDAKKMEIRKFKLTYRQDSALPIRYSDSRKIPSSNHDIPFTIDHDGDFLEVNVSIPKMLWGNNVAELVIPPGHKHFTVNNISPFDHIDYVFDSLKLTVEKCVDLIAQQNFVGLRWEDVEVRRIDICINQHFSSKDEALRYLNYIKNIQKKHNRQEGVSNAAAFKTAVTYKTKRYYAKIYHKGTEFAQMQARQIIKINDARRKKGMKFLSSSISYAALEIQRLQEYADKILRYEVEFKKPYLNYIFNYKVNKSWSETVWKKCVSLFQFFKKNEHFKLNAFQFVKKYENENGEMVDYKPVLCRRILYFHTVWNEVAKVHELIPFNNKEYERLRQMREFGITNKDRLDKWIEYMEGELNATRKFTFAVDRNEYEDTTEKEYYLNGQVHQVQPFCETPTTVRFTKSLLFEMMRSMRDFFNNFQVINKGPLEELEDKVKAWNETIQDRLLTAVTKQDKARLEKLVFGDRRIRNLYQYHRLHSKFTHKQLVPKIYSRATYYRVRKDYQMITGRKEQIASAHFSNVIERNFEKIYIQLFNAIQFDFLGNFYTEGFKNFARMSNEEKRVEKVGAITNLSKKIRKVIE